MRPGGVLDGQSQLCCFVRGQGEILFCADVEVAVVCRAGCRIRDEFLFSEELEGCRCVVDVIEHVFRRCEGVETVEEAFQTFNWITNVVFSGEAGVDENGASVDCADPEIVVDDGEVLSEGGENPGVVDFGVSCDVDELVETVCVAGGINGYCAVGCSKSSDCDGRCRIKGEGAAVCERNRIRRQYGVPDCHSAVSVDIEPVEFGGGGIRDVQVGLREVRIVRGLVGIVRNGQTFEFIGRGFVENVGGSDADNAVVDESSTVCNIEGCGVVVVAVRIVSLLLAADNRFCCFVAVDIVGTDGDVAAEDTKECAIVNIDFSACCENTEAAAAFSLHCGVVQEIKLSGNVEPEVSVLIGIVGAVKDDVGIAIDFEERSSAVVSDLGLDELDRHSCEGLEVAVSAEEDVLKLVFDRCIVSDRIAVFILFPVGVGCAADGHIELAVAVLLRLDGEVFRIGSFCDRGIVVARILDLDGRIGACGVDCIVGLCEGVDAEVETFLNQIADFISFRPLLVDKECAHVNGGRSIGSVLICHGCETGCEVLGDDFRITAEDAGNVLSVFIFDCIECESGVRFRIACRSIVFRADEFCKSERGGVSGFGDDLAIGQIHDGVCCSEGETVFLIVAFRELRECFGEGAAFDDSIEVRTKGGDETVLSGVITCSEEAVSEESFSGGIGAVEGSPAVELGIGDFDFVHAAAVNCVNLRDDAAVVDFHRTAVVRAGVDGVAGVLECAGVEREPRCLICPDESHAALSVAVEREVLQRDSGVLDVEESHRIERSCNHGGTGFDCECGAGCAFDGDRFVDGQGLVERDVAEQSNGVAVLSGRESCSDGSVFDSADFCNIIFDIGVVVKRFDGDVAFAGLADAEDFVFADSAVVKRYDCCGGVFVNKNFGSESVCFSVTVDRDLVNG